MTTPELELFELLQDAEAVKPSAPSEDSAVEKELLEGDPDRGTPIGIHNLFTHYDTHPVVLYFALLKTFDTKWIRWEAETIWAEVRRVFKTQISEHARAKIQVVKTCQVSHLPWEKWQVFEKVVQGLNNNIPRWQYMQAPSLEELFAAIDIMKVLRVANFSSEVRLYMAAAVLNEDVLFVPPPLDFIQTEVSQPSWKCRDCGNEDSALFHDGICDTCTRKFSPDKGLSMLPDTKLLSEGKGKNLELVLRYNPDAVQEKWDKVKDLPAAEVPFEESPVGTQIDKLLAARDYMNVRRRQMTDQLTNLKSWLGAPT